MNAIDFHERIAASFNDKYQSSKAFQERFAVWTALFATYVKATDRVLDLGCGTGVFSDYLAKKGCTVTGIDGSAAMIALCQQRQTTDNAHYVLNTLPLIDPTPYGEKDVVLMSSFLEYMAEPAIMLRQASILLRPNGLLFVSIPNQKSIYRMMERVLFKLLKRPAYYQHSRYAITEAVLNHHLRTLGFEGLETVYFSGQDPLSRWLKPWLTKPYTNTLLVGVYQKVSV